MQALINPNNGYIVQQIEVQKFPVSPPCFWVNCDETVNVGYVWQNGVFLAPVPPVPPVPTEVSMFQAEEALAEFGLLEAVEEFMDHPDTPEKYKRAWRRAGSVRRDSEVVATMAALLVLNDAQLDELFTFASTVTA